MTAYPKRFFLQPQETVVAEAAMARAWAIEQVFSHFVVGLLVWGGLATIVYFRQPPGGQTLLYVLTGVFALHLLLVLVYVWRRLATTEYVVTDGAAYARRGRLLIDLAVASLDRVTDLYVTTSLLGRIFGYSTLSVRTAGGGLSMAGLVDAYRIRAAVQEARQAFLTKLLQESGRAASSKPGPQTLCQCPGCFTAFPVPPQRPLDVRCPQCGETGTLFAEAIA